MMKYLKVIILCLTIVQCSISKKTNSNDIQKFEFKVDTLTLNDQTRNRKIPVAIYQPKNENHLNKIPIIFSHGYGENKGGDYLYAYTYLTEFLASKGYFVVSIQHELPTDELLAMTGKLNETRRLNWESGVKNILFVLKEIEKIYPKLEYNKLTLIGHSNGGDMTALFANHYPELVSRIITMDNRRMKLPRTKKIKIFTLRSNDYPADENVLPTDEEAKEYNIVIQPTDINHSNMDNDANEKERKFMANKILEYLEK